MCVEVVRIARRPVVRVLPGEVIGVFAHVERADEHRAGGFEPRDQRRVGLGRRQVAIDLGAGARRQALDVEQVLDRERRAGERPQLLARAPARASIAAAFASARSADHVGEGAVSVVARLDAPQRRARHLDGARPAVPDRGGDRRAPIRRAAASWPEHRGGLVLVADRARQKKRGLLGGDLRGGESVAARDSGVSAIFSSGAIASTSASGSNGVSVMRSLF